MGNKELSDLVALLVDEGEMKSGDTIRVTHLSEDDKDTLKKEYFEKKDIKYVEIIVVDALKLKRGYSVELTYLGGSQNA